MAKPAPGARTAPSRRKFGLADLGRLTLWTFCAAFALTIAAYAGTTEIGRHRLVAAVTEARQALFSTGDAQPKPLDAREGRRLAENMRTLTAERDQLVARVATLERNLGDVTGSIARVEKAAQATQQALAAAARPQQQPAAPSEEVTASVPPQPAPVPLPPPAPGRSEYGLDLGSAPNVEGVRALWLTAQRRYSTLLDGLRPIVQTRERRPGAEDLHLIVGPIPNAATAARLCATITATGALCQPSSYEGQRLALR